MTSISQTRRQIVKASLAIPLILKLPLTLANESRSIGTALEFSDNIRRELINIYGSDDVVYTDKLITTAPPIAENGSQVPCRILGEKGLCSSLTIFVSKNPKPLVGTFNFKEGADLKIRTRFKMSRTSDVLVVAQTENGLIGKIREIKITHRGGCS